MVRLRCSTLFDITMCESALRTGRSNNRTGAQLANQQITNWNTLQQILMLRTLPENISTPICSHGIWSFEFDIPQLAAVAWGADPVGALRYDANGVPMITGLTESTTLPGFLVPYGDAPNVWFDLAKTK